MFHHQPVFTQYSVSLSGLPQQFCGFSIALLSDIHGQIAPRLLGQLQKSQPELIAITGDLVDSRSRQSADALAFLREAAAIAPCFFVPGNHESRLPEYPELAKAMGRLGITVLEDRAVPVFRNGGEILVLGIADPGFPGGMERVECALRKMCRYDGFRLLLAHRPEHFPMYSGLGADLTLSGHAHGGQVRLPGIGGLFAPGQGFFPKWNGGVYALGESKMVVSRGLSSCPPFRLGNPTELVKITLTR